MSNAALNREIRNAARSVVARWERGDLAGAVNRLDLALDDWKENRTKGNKTGAALAVAVSGLASLVTQLERPALEVRDMAQDRKVLAVQGRALLNRLGAMVKP